MMRLFRSLFRCCALSACTLFVSASAQAAAINLVVDSSQSSLSLAGGAFGLTYTQQGPGSLTSSLSGNITADLTAGVFSFSGGSGIVFDVNPNGPYDTSPHPNGIIPGSYGVTAAGVVNPFGNVIINGVYRNMTLDITAGTAQNGQAMSGGNMLFTSGEIVFGAATQFAGNVPGNSALNSQGNNTSLGLVSWDGTTLTIPVEFLTQGGNGRFENWSGSVVARVVPEPSSFALLSLVTLVGLVRRRSVAL